MHEIRKAAIKQLITDHGTASSEYIGARLGWGVSRLADWLARCGYPCDEIDLPILADLCAKGIQ
jgi:hypothetical protein